VRQAFNSPKGLLKAITSRCTRPATTIANPQHRILRPENRTMDMDQDMVSTNLAPYTFAPIENQACNIFSKGLMGHV
jgi:hypothetical protein